jgi:hypothetical protein
MRSKAFMRVIPLVIMLTLGAPIVLAQNESQIKECESSATTEEDRAGCARLAQCASQCGGDDSCMLTCTAPGRGAEISLFSPTDSTPIRGSPRSKERKQARPARSDCALQAVV